MKKITIKRGGIYLLDNADVYGYEIAKRRPFIVVSKPSFTANTGFAVVAPITSTSRKGNPGYIDVETHCEVHGQVCWVQLKSVDIAARNPKYLGQVTDETLKKLRNAAQVLLTL